jgi:diguanylate cyclase (GGDEF)-like protein
MFGAADRRARTVLRFCTLLLTTLVQSLWALPGVTANGVPAQQYRAPATVSMMRPSTMMLRIPYEARWRRADWYVVADYPVDAGTLLATLESGGTSVTRFGMLVPMAQRSVKRATPTVMIPRGIAPGSAITLVLRSEIAHPALRLEAAQALEAEQTANWTVMAYPLLLVCGILLALAISNLIYYRASGQVAFIYYCGVVLSATALTLLASPGVFWGWLFPNLSAPYRIVNDLALLAYMLFAVGFGRSFLNLRRWDPRFDRVLVGALGLYAATFLALELFFTDMPGEQILADAAGLALLTLLLAAGVPAVRRGYETAFYYVIAFAGALAGAVVYYAYGTLAGTQAWPAIFLGVSWQGCWLTAALAGRLRKLQEAREIEQLERIAEREHATFHDPLTGLFNRGKIEAELRAVSTWMSGSPRTLALLYFDLDHFKVINDTSGHDAGDRLLVEVGKVLASLTGPDDTLARVGGDEFVMLLRDRDNGEVSEVANAARERVAGMQFTVDGHAFPVSVSLGVALLRLGIYAGALFELADAACATAKESGRNRIRFVSDETSAEQARSEMIWTTRILSAVEEDRMTLYYQSIQPTRWRLGQRGTYVEIFVRMIGEDGAVLEPPHFMSAAEHYNLTARIDRWVIGAALPMLAPFIQRGNIQSVALNLSRDSLRDADLGTFIADRIREADVEPSAICFEVTETAVASALGSFTALTMALRPLGVRFALDEFGAGASSLALLKRLDVDYLKIDRSFVHDCALNDVDAAMVEAIHRFAKVLGLQTIAEQAHDAATVARLREIGVDFIQGWASSHPQPIETLTNAMSA